MGECMDGWVDGWMSHVKSLAIKYISTYGWVWGWIICGDISMHTPTRVSHWQLKLLVSPIVQLSGGSRISPRRGCQLPRGVPTYDFAILSQKLHKIERIWVPGGASLAPPLDPPLQLFDFLTIDTPCTTANFGHFLTFWYLAPYFNQLGPLQGYFCSTDKIRYLAKFKLSNPANWVQTKLQIPQCFNIS